MAVEIPLFLYAALFVLSLFLAKKLLFASSRLPPSPAVGFPVIGHLYLLKRPVHRTLAHLAARRGPVLHLQLGSRSVVVISSPAAVEECFTKNDLAFANRPRLLAGKHLGYDYTSIVWSSYGDHWRLLRKLASVELLSSNRVHFSSDIRSEEAKFLIRKLYRSWEAAGGESCEVDLKAAFFTLQMNVMMLMVAGKRYSDDDEKLEDVEEGRMFNEIVKETFALSSATNIVDFLPVLKFVGLNKMEKKLERLQEKRERFVHRLVERAKRLREETLSKARSKTMIDILLSLQEAEPDRYTDTLINGMIMVMLTTGTDTSAGTMEWAMAFLVNNPQVLCVAQAEIDSKVGQSRLLEESDLADLPYLQAVVNETLRVQPAAPLVPAHESSSECTIGTYRIPLGTMLLVNAWAVHNDVGLWEKPEEFRPKRWMEGGEGQMKGKEFAYLPFGAGRRRCPGEALAARVVALVVGRLVQCFEWERIGKEIEDMSEGVGLTAPKATPLVAKCRPRRFAVDGQLLSQQL